MQNVYITVLKLQKAQTPSNILATLTSWWQNITEHLCQQKISIQLLELFSNFFCNKVQTIRDHLDKHLSVPEQDSPHAHDNQFSGCPFNSFTSILANKIHYEKVYFTCAPKTCELDAIPTSLFFECLDAILPTLTIVVHHSLLTGEFPLIFKTAIVKPLLKKTSLDP